MTLWSRIRSWLRAMVGRSRMESEMDAELRFHMKAYAEDLLRGGVPRQEAMRRARVEFGGTERIKEECRESLSLSIFDGLRRDVRYGLRVLRKNPGLSTALCLTLGLAIGANTAVFELAYSILIRPLPYPSPGTEPLVRGPGRLY
jgi:hypothetical protein